MEITVQQWLSERFNKGTCHETKLYPPFYEVEPSILIGLCEFSGKENMFKIYKGARYNGTYDISADRIMTGRGLLDFIFQIHSKEWITGQHIKDFLDCVLCWVYRDHGKMPQEFFNVIHGMNAGMDAPNEL